MHNNRQTLHIDSLTQVVRAMKITQAKQKPLEGTLPTK